jgi:hypothetical protein
VTAHAEPPEVTANQNPVIVPFLKSTKEITLTWRLERGSTLANLIVTESDNPFPVLSQLVSSPSSEGTVPLVVTYGKTYTAQLYAPVIFGPPLGAPLTITTKRPDFVDPDLGCALQCITSVDVQPHGGWAQFTIKTNETAVITLEASTTPPNPDGTWSNPDAVTAFAGSVMPTDQYTPPLANLQSNTTYHYVVRAREHGNESVEIGSFTTLTRRVDVDFNEIQMIEDSDGLAAADCDCFFYFGVGDATPMRYGSSENPISVGSDTTVPLDADASITGAPSEIRLGAIAWDSDYVLGQLCAVGSGPPTSDEHWEASGSGGCMEWAGNKILVSLSRQGPPVNPGAVDEQFTEPFTINVNGALVYKVRGTYKVTYE